MDNYNNVLAQIQDHGLLVDRLEVGRMIRCKTNEDSEKRGWYVLHEMQIDGSSLLVGSYGIWHGDDNGAIKIQIDKSHNLTAEQQKAIRDRIKEDKRLSDLALKKRQNEAARLADAEWAKGLPDGHVDYLDKKQIQPFGCKFSEDGRLMIPIMNYQGQIRGIQYILDGQKHKDQIQKTGRNKDFWPKGLEKKGNYHLIGTPMDVLLVAEGFATAASLHMATGFAVVVAFDAGNIGPVCEILKRRYKKCQIIICADDDSLARCGSCDKPIEIKAPECSECGQPHGKKNTGLEAASLTAMKLGLKWLKPHWSDREHRLDEYRKNRKLTDFNDLACADSLLTVRNQIDLALDDLDVRGKTAGARPTKQGEGENLLKPIDTVEELLQRFILVYGMGGMVFDKQEHMLLSTSDMRDACTSRELSRRWQEEPSRVIVKSQNVGFDPACEDPNIKCNLWAGWPTEPKKGKCELLLELLEYMCTNETKHVELYDWVLKWLAYPIQNPGAKMKTCLVIHGPQGTGKNLFFEAVMAIYGMYGRVIDQSAVEDKFNDWASRKLFLIADEVVARAELYHIKNKLKAFISGDWIRINPKGMAAYEERNHVNVVFLSNERMPSVLEEDDRRHCVIWTPKKLDEDFYKAVSAEIQNGGIEALHDYLLNLNLDGFTPHSKPPITEAKMDLINLGKDNILRFYDDWVAGDLDIDLLPALTEDLYELYKIWCQRQGVRSVPMNKVIDAIAKRPSVIKSRKRYQNSVTKSNPKTFIFAPGFKEMNPGLSEIVWLGDCVDKFKEQIKEYRGSNFD